MTPSRTGSMTPSRKDSSSASVPPSPSKTTLQTSSGTPTSSTLPSPFSGQSVVIEYVITGTVTLTADANVLVDDDVIQVVKSTARTAIALALDVLVDTITILSVQLTADKSSVLDVTYSITSDSLESALDIRDTLSDLQRITDVVGTTFNDEGLSFLTVTSVKPPSIEQQVSYQSASTDGPSSSSSKSLVPVIAGSRRRRCCHRHRHRDSHASTEGAGRR